MKSFKISSKFAVNILFLTLNHPTILKKKKAEA
jgi:hypothetical protein